MDKMRKRKCLASGADGVYCEMIFVDPHLSQRVILSLWEGCGHVGKFSWMFRLELVDPVFKSVLRSDDSRFRDIGLLSQIRGIIDAALDIMIQDFYTRHIGQYGFFKKTGMGQAIFRLLLHVRDFAGPAISLDLADAYPSVKRALLLRMLKKRLPARLASILSLGPIDGMRAIVGDDRGRLVSFVRGLTQGGVPPAHSSPFLLSHFCRFSTLTVLAQSLLMCQMM